MINQVLSISQMEELVHLGVDTSKASMCWVWHQQGEGGYHKLEVNIDLYPCNKDVPIFTLQDILEILPKPCYINCIDEDFYQCEVTTNNGSLNTNGKTAIVAAFNMLKLCNRMKTFNIELQQVTSEQAKALKELGFPQNIEKHNHNWVNPKGVYGGPFESDSIMCPTLELVTKWLRKEKNIDLYARPYFEETDNGTYIKSGYTYEISPLPIKCLKVYPTYEEALSAGIDKVIEIFQ